MIWELYIKTKRNMKKHLKILINVLTWTQNLKLRSFKKQSAYVSCSKFKKPYYALSKLLYSIQNLKKHIFFQEFSINNKSNIKKQFKISINAYNWAIQMQSLRKEFA